MIADRLWLIAVAGVLTMVVAVAYLRLGDRGLARLPSPWYRRIIPWLFLGPAALIVGFVLVFPGVSTVILSFFNADSTSFVGIDNYVSALTDSVTLIALRNTALWVLLLPSLAAFVGLLIAVLADRVRYGALVKLALFLPIAVSAVAAGVIWTFMYDYQPPVAAQTGTVNAVLTAVTNLEPVAWIIDEATNNYALIAATLWTQAGFAMVIFSAALRSVPDELLDAARIDGASEVGIYSRIVLPMISPGLISLGLIFFMNTWNSFLWPLVILKSPENFTLPLLIRSMTGTVGRTVYDVQMAASVVSIIPLLIIFLIFQRRFIEGITAGALD